MSETETERELVISIGSGQCFIQACFTLAKQTSFNAAAAPPSEIYLWPTYSCQFIYSKIVGVCVHSLVFILNLELLCEGHQQQRIASALCSTYIMSKRGKKLACSRAGLAG